MIRREAVCPGCPFSSRRTGPPVPAEVMATVMQRIRSGEEWICHQTCDGPRVTPDSQLCAGAPQITHQALPSQKTRVRPSGPSGSDARPSTNWPATGTTATVLPEESVRLT